MFKYYVPVLNYADLTHDEEELIMRKKSTKGVKNFSNWQCLYKKEVTYMKKNRMKAVLKKKDIQIHFHFYF